MSSAKQYLGDGVYVAMDESRDMLVLTTENGIEATNVIYLEEQVRDALVRYIKTEPWNEPRRCELCGLPWNRCEGHGRATT
jgi:hypothetical protein